MSKPENLIRQERYTSRYTRGFLKMLINDSQTETDKYVSQFYASKNYQGRLEAVTFLLNVQSRQTFPKEIIKDALKDFCSQVKVYVLQNYDFVFSADPELSGMLADIAKNDEKIQVRTLALKKLSHLRRAADHELFFTISLVKSSKESAAGLRALFALDPSKAYQIAKFRAENSSGTLDLAIAEIFYSEGDCNDLGFFRNRLKARNRFNKLELIRIYLKMLGKLDRDDLIKDHLIYINKDVTSTGNTDLIQRLILEIYNFMSEHQVLLTADKPLNSFLNSLIDRLLDKKY